MLKAHFAVAMERAQLLPLYLPWKTETKSNRKEVYRQDCYPLKSLYLRFI